MDNYMKVIINAIKQWVESNLAIFNNALEKKIDNDFIVFGDTLEKKIDNKIDDVAAKIPEQVKPDWNQNDSNELDYIKNRPFYEDTLYETYVEEQTVLLENEGNWYILTGEFLGWGDTWWRVTFDGVVYDNMQMVEDDAGEEAWGNITTNNEDQIEIDNDLSVKIPESLIGEHTFKIEKIINNIVRIDDKFLPIAAYKGEGENALCLNSPLNSASGYYSHAEGLSTTASGRGSHAEGEHTTASGGSSHAEGASTTASGSDSHAEGASTTASGLHSHAEGDVTEASGSGSHAEGSHTVASDFYSHAEGGYTVASGRSSHAEGEHTIASGRSSHAEGGYTVASDLYSHAEGEHTIASGRGSHAEGLNNTTFGDYQFVHGKNNKKEYDEYTEEYNFTSSSYGYASNTYVYDNISGLFTLGDDALGVYAGKVNNKYWIEKKATGSVMYYIESFPKAIKYTSSARQFAHIIGNGLDENNNSNAHTLDWSGNAWYQGDVYVGSTSGTNRDDGSKKLATEQYVNDVITAIDIPDVPVQSVNNKTGAVTLTASDVGARPSSWMPSASDVGALPDSTVIPAKVSELENDKGYLTEHQDISGKLDASALPTAINTALAQAKASGEFDGKDGADGKDGKDYTFDPTVYDLPVLELTGDISPIKVSKDNKATLSYVYGDRSGSCTLKGQGATSYKTAQALVNAGKKGKFNYTIKFDTAFEAKEGWGAQQKYCLKANFIDPTHSRNIVSCKLWGMSVKARSTVPTELANLPNCGAIDGFPIVIMLNGEFHGLYTWNIPKDGWMFGLVEDSSKTQAIVGADDHTTATQFKEASMSGFEVEFASDEDNMDWVETSLTRLISAVMNSDGSDLDTTVAQYLDWDSAIDHYIHTVVDKATDCVDKNYLLVTFDGVKWYMSQYDRDSIHGLNWDASGTTRPVSNCSFVECAETVRIYELIKRFKTNALKARYKALRSNILSESRIMEKFENFAWAIPSPVMLEDVKLYPTIKGSGVNTIDQIGRFVRQRLVRCDEWIDALPAQESTGGSTVTTYAVTNALSNCVSSNGATAVNANAAYSATITASDGYTLDGATVTVTMGGTNITSMAYSGGKISIDSVTGAVVITVSAVKKASGYTNLVKSAVDTDGSLYNGCGYKDNARLSSSGGVSGTAQNGSVVTGFMPFTPGSTIRLKGAEYLGAGNKYGGHYYINFYDVNKSFKVAVTEGEVVNNTGSCFEANHDATTGITTIKLINGASSDYGTKIDASSFFRINAYGKGADLIVTVNEEIT